MQLIKKGLYQRFFPVLEQLSANVFVLGAWPCAALSKQKVFYLALLMNKQPSQVMKAI